MDIIEYNVLKWQLARAEDALSAMADIDFDKSDTAGYIEDFADELRQKIEEMEGEDG